MMLRSNCKQWTSRMLTDRRHAEEKSILGRYVKTNKINMWVKTIS